MSTICERTLEACRANGDSVQLTVRVYKPYPDSKEGGDWACDFRITGLDTEIAKTLYGVDSMQALLHAVKGASAHLSQIENLQGFRLTWLGMKDLGFHTNSLKI